MNLNGTKHYSVGSIRTIIDNYMIENHHQQWKKEMEEGDLVEAQFMRAKRAMDYLNTLIAKGYQEHEAWEIVSSEIVYQM